MKSRRIGKSTSRSLVRKMRNPNIPWGTLPVARPKTIPPPESLTWWWHPSRAGVTTAPAWFRAKLEKVGADLECTWSPYHQLYLVWLKAPRVQTKPCWGWKLLFTFPPDKLDDRQFARLYQASARRWGSAKEYFDAIEREQRIEKERRDKYSEGELLAGARDRFRANLRIHSYVPSTYQSTAAN